MFDGRHINLAIKKEVNKQFSIIGEKFIGLDRQWADYTKDDLKPIIQILHSRSNVGEKLSLFRLPKSFAILFFNLATICLSFGIFIMFFGVYLLSHNAVEYYDIFWPILLFGTWRLFLLIRALACKESYLLLSKEHLYQFRILLKQADLPQHGDR